MHAPHTATRLHTALAALVSLFLLAPHAAARQSARADEAARLHQRGVERARKGKRKDALKDLGRALDMRLRAFHKESYAQAGEVADPGREVSERRRLRFAAAARALVETAEQYAPLGPPDAALWLAYLDTLRLLASLAEDRRFEAEPFVLGRLMKKAVLLSKPEPGFTEKARRRNTSGVVRLRALLGADGKVKEVAVMKPLRDGLTEKAVEAAGRIRFDPATLEGRPIPQLIIIEYNFNVY